MINIFKKQNGMDIVGQGGKIILFMLPSLVGAILVHTFGKENEDYITRVDRLIPFKKPC